MVDIGCSHTSEPKVSTIILNYNGRGLLGACISSLLDSDFPEERLEVIVVDNGSTDGSVEFIKSEWPNVVLIENQINLGFSKAANLGAAYATGEYIAFLNNDMRVDKKWLSVLVNIACAGKGFACVGSTVLNWDGTRVDFIGRPDDAFCLAYTPLSSSQSAPPTSGTYFRALFVSGGAVLIRRDVFQELGGFDPDFFLYQEDVDLGWRLWLRGYECAISTESLVYHKGGATSSKLPPEYIQSLSQRNTLFSVFKNLEAKTLLEVLPRLLYSFLERGRWVPAARLSLWTAIRGFQSCVISLIEKRNQVQRTRVKTDLDLFELLGNPFDSLFRESSYEIVRKDAVEPGWHTDFDPDDAESVRNAIIESLNQAHLLYESHLTTEVSDYQKQIERLSDSIEDLKAQREENDAARQKLASELEKTEVELKRIRLSLGWRLLSRYGRIKYRYLLPAYRLAGSIRARLRKADKKSPRFKELSRSDCYDIICLPIIDWDFRFQRPQQLLKQFALDGHRVFYICTRFDPSGATALAKELEKSVYDVRLPGPAHVNCYREEIGQRLLDHFVTSLEHFRDEYGLEEAICLVQLPFWAPLALELRRRWGWRIVYDCMDEHAGFSTTNSTMLNHEGALIAGSDLVLATSRALYKKACDRARRTILLPNAADFEHFSSRSADQPLSDMPTPIVGYYGAISEWFDVEMIRNAAVARPDWQFVLIGDTFGANLSSLKSLANIHLMGERPYASLPGYLHQFDVACIPFLRNRLTEATNPVKFYEYLSAGKPVVATDLPELEPYADYFYPVRSSADFVPQVEAALKEDSPARIQTRMEFARNNTWRQRHETLKSSIRELYPKATIIIVSFKNLNYLRMCLASIWDKTLYPNFEVIVVDNGAQPDIVEYLQNCAREEPRLTIILNGKNLGFACANNIGIRAANNSEYVVLLNDDTVVTRGWLGKLIRHLEDDSVGLIGPVTNWAGNEAKINVGYQTIKEMDEFALRYTREHSGKSFEIRMLAMYCIGMRKLLLDEIGLLDEQFGIGLFEDDDFSIRVQQAGYKLICAEDIFIHHWGRASFGKIDQGSYNQLFEENRKKFEAKWGRKWKAHKSRT